MLFSNQMVGPHVLRWLGNGFAAQVVKRWQIWPICFGRTWMRHHCTCWAYITQQFQWALGLAYVNYRTCFCIGNRRVCAECKGSQELKQLWKIWCYHRCYANWVWVEIRVLLAWLKSTWWKHQCYCKIWWHAGVHTLCREASSKTVQHKQFSFIPLFSVWGSCRSNNKSFFLGKGHQMSTKQQFWWRKMYMCWGRKLLGIFSALSTEGMSVEKHTLVYCHSSRTAGTPHGLFF